MVRPLGYELRSHGVVMGGAADLQILRHWKTRAELCRGWFGAAPDLAGLAE